MIAKFLRITSQKLFSNFWWKLGALILAIVIWFTISSEGRADKTIVDIPYELRNLPLNLEIIDRGIGMVQITARGPQNLINSLKANDISVPVDMPDDVGPGDVKLLLTQNNVQTQYPNQITILQISPPEINIKLEETATKTVRIIPFVKGNPADGFELGTREVLPSNAEIIGPISMIESLGKIYTNQIDVEGVDRTFNERVELNPTDQLIRIVSPIRVTVTIEVNEKIIERTFPEFTVSVVTSEQDPGIEFDPGVVTLTMKGPQVVITTLQASDLEIIADLRELPPGSHEIPFVLKNPPERIISFVTDPESLTVIIPTPIPVTPIPVIPADNPGG